jgi:hypothetical protein
MSQEELNTIQEQFKNAMCFEDSVSRFNALIEVAKATDSSSLPIQIKDRINQRIHENQMRVAGLIK